MTIAVRDLSAGEKVAKDISQSTSNEKIFVSKLDLSEQTSIDNFTKQWEGSLDILINNAGMICQELTKKNGMELQFLTNYVGPFLLTLGLHGALAKAGRARVVCVSSVGHLFSPLVFEDIHFSSRSMEAFPHFFEHIQTANNPQSKKRKKLSKTSLTASLFIYLTKTTLNNFGKKL